MCVCVYVCMCVCVHLCMCVCVYVCICHPTTVTPTQFSYHCHPHSPQWMKNSPISWVQWPMTLPADMIGVHCQGELCAMRKNYTISAA